MPTKPAAMPVPMSAAVNFGVKCDAFMTGFPNAGNRYFTAGVIGNTRCRLADVFHLRLIASLC